MGIDRSSARNTITYNNIRNFCWRKLCMRINLLRNYDSYMNSNL